MKWIIGIALTLLIAFIFGQVHFFVTHGVFGNYAEQSGWGVPAALITGVLGPYFLIDKPERKNKILGFGLWIVLLILYWFFIT
jgi:hypothetical protein